MLLDAVKIPSDKFDVVFLSSSGKRGEECANNACSKMHNEPKCYHLLSAHLPRVQCGRVGLVVDDRVKKGGVRVLGEAVHRDAVDCREGDGVEAGHVKEPVAANEGFAARLQCQGTSVVLTKISTH